MILSAVDRVDSSCSTLSILQSTPGHCRSVQDSALKALIRLKQLKGQRYAAPICSSKQLSSGCPSPLSPFLLPFPPLPSLPPLIGLGRCQPRCLLEARESRPRWPWVLHSASSTRCTTAAEAAAAQSCKAAPGATTTFSTHHHHHHHQHHLHHLQQQLSHHFR